MNISIRSILNLVIFVLFFSDLFSQIKDNEFLMDSSVYKKKSSWFTASVGLGYNLKTTSQETNTDFSYHFQPKKGNICLQAGFHLTSDEFFLNRSFQKCEDLHLGIGWRKETLMNNFAIFAGPSYAYGSYFYGYIGDAKAYKGFTTAGLFADMEYTYQMFYDVGIGINMYCSINNCYQVAGVQFHLYFSGAYKGKVKKR